MAGENIPIIVKKVLSKRGMSEAVMARYLAPDYERHLHDPFLMTDMGLAVERIIRAADKGEKTVIYGDYDIDGLTASVVMRDTLAAFGIDAEVYIPDRFDEGYGLNPEAIRRLAEKGTRLIVTVDCGVTAVAEAELARELGMDLIITDHHSVPEIIPAAVAVVNPKRQGDKYPFKELCGAGVAFKLAQALQLKTGKPAAGQEKWLLDMVALGSVGDVVELLDENRVLVSYGLKVMRRTKRPGLKALAAVAGVNIDQVSSTQLGFNLGPRLNAAGRMRQAGLAYELLSTSDETRAAYVAVELEELNKRRRTEQDRIFSEADLMADVMADDPVMVLAHPDWSHGIVGMVASKLADKWQRPIFVGQVMGDKIKGSARSRGDYDLAAAFRHNGRFLEKFGGHFYAAGCTFNAKNIDDFRDGLIEYFFENSSGEIPATAPADIVADGLGDINWDAFEQLEMMEPFGAGNPKPIFEVRNTKVTQYRTMGKEGKHLKICVLDNNSQSIEAVGFGFGEIGQSLMEKSVIMLGELNKNEFRDTVSLEFGIIEITFE